MPPLIEMFEQYNQTLADYFEVFNQDTLPFDYHRYLTLSDPAMPFPPDLSGNDLEDLD